MHRQQAGRRHRVFGYSSPGLSLTTIFLVTLYSYVDRSLISVLQIPIKHDLGLSDGQLGALTGLSFAIVYSLIGIPVSRLADGAGRKWLMAAALALWSLMTACSSLATSFTMLVIFRMGLALGESACGPIGVSLVPDLFSRKRRGLPFAILAMATPLGTMIGMASAGWLSAEHGWQHAFLIIGLAGFLLLPLVMGMREPERGRHDDDPVAVRAPLPFASAFAHIWRTPTMRYLLAGAAFQSFTFTAVSVWAAPFYTRTFGIPLTQIGFLLGTVFGLIGGVAALCGGQLADRLGRQDILWYTRIPVVSAFAVLPVGLGEMLYPDATVSLVLGAVMAVLLHIYIAPMNVALQSLAHPRARGLTAAILSFLGGVFGFGLGPLVTGLLSDWFASNGLGTDALRYALVVSLGASVIAGFCFLRAALHIQADMV